VSVPKLAIGQHLKPFVHTVVYRSKTTNQPTSLCYRDDPDLPLTPITDAKLSFVPACKALSPREREEERCEIARSPRGYDSLHDLHTHEHNQPTNHNDIMYLRLFSRWFLAIILFFKRLSQIGCMRCIATGKGLIGGGGFVEGRSCS
jgi:hypothetical protein